MWISKKKWMDLQRRLAKVEFGLKKPTLTNGIITQYVNDEIAHQELRISLSGSDLCKLQSRKFYPKLIKFLDNL